MALTRLSIFIRGFNVSGNGPPLALQVITLDEGMTSVNTSSFYPSFSYLRETMLGEMDSSILSSWNGIVGSR